MDSATVKARGFSMAEVSHTCVRAELKKGPKTISHKDLQRLWCGIDVNNDNSVEKDEMGAFIKRSFLDAKAVAKKKNWGMRALNNTFTKKSSQAYVAPSP